MRLHYDKGIFYIGSTEKTVLFREQSRVRKFRQLVSGHLGYYEPALKLWHRMNNFYDFCIFPIDICLSAELLMMEASLQQTCQPQLNWPWINSLLKKCGILDVNIMVCYSLNLIELLERNYYVDIVIVHKRHR